MKIIAVIPARYASTRFPGKPLVDICGKPMIQWVYERVSNVKKLSNVFVAIDDERIRKVCESKGIKYIMTRNDHPDHIARIQEISEKVQADVYVCVNGDEPLISPECIEQVVPTSLPMDFFFIGAMRLMDNAAETLDPSRIKVVVAEDGRCLYISRSPVPYPKGTLMFQYNKYVGIECFSKEALDFFVSTPQSMLEKIEDIDHLRYLEHDKKLYFKYVDSESISVDTPKDVEKVRLLMKNMLAKTKQ